MFWSRILYSKCDNQMPSRIPPITSPPPGGNRQGPRGLLSGCYPIKDIIGSIQQLSPHFFFFAGKKKKEDLQPVD